MSGLTREGFRELTIMVCEGIVDLSEGRKPKWVVNLEVLK